jgi:hypothetical protein
MTKQRWLPENINRRYFRELKKLSDEEIAAQKEAHDDFIIRAVKSAKIAYDKGQREAREREIRFQINQARKARRP